MNDLDERLTRHLERQARLIDVGAPSMVHVTRRAAQRRNRRRTAVGIVGTAAVSVATIAGIQALSRPNGGKRIVPVSPTATTETPGVGTVQQAQSIESNLVWNRFEPDSAAALGFGFGQVATSNGLFAWSTQPGRSDSPSQVLYRSDDGVSWQQVTDSTGAPPARLTAAGDQIYSFGTTTATAAGLSTQPTLRVSTDAVDWQDLDLPIDLGDLSGLGPDVTAVIEPTAFAVGEHGAIAIVTVRPRLSGELIAQLGAVQRIDAAGVTIADQCAASSVTTTMVMAGGPAVGTAPPRTVEVTAPASTTPAAADATTTTTMEMTPAKGTSPSCPQDAAPEHTRPWSDLGVDPAAAAVFARPAQVFVSTDGQHFVAAGELPALPTGTQYADTRAIATPDGFAVLRNSAGPDGQSQPAELLTSGDGSTWQSTEIGGGGGTVAFGRLADGSIVNLSYGGSSPSVWILRDGTTQTVSLDGVVTSDDGPYATLSGISYGDVSDTGITLIGYINNDVVKAAGQPSMTRDGVTLTLLDGNGRLRFTDAATGAELPTPDGVLDRTSDFVVWDVTAADGSIVRFSGEDVGALYPNDSSAQQPRMVVLHSADGVSWTRDDLATIAGLDPATPIGAVNVLAEGNKVIISTTEVPLGATDPNGPLPKTVVMVGTPAN